MREEICEYLGYLGVKIDSEKNAQARGKEEESPHRIPKVKVYVIPTNEELAIARETKGFGIISFLIKNLLTKKV